MTDSGAFHCATPALGNAPTIVRQQGKHAMPMPETPEQAEKRRVRRRKRYANVVAVWKYALELRPRYRMQYKAGQQVVLHTSSFTVPEAYRGSIRVTEVGRRFIAIEGSYAARLELDIYGYATVDYYHDRDNGTRVEAQIVAFPLPYPDECSDGVVIVGQADQNQPLCLPHVEGEPYAQPHVIVPRYVAAAFDVYRDAWRPWK
jgi:hypothetical protein